MSVQAISWSLGRAPKFAPQAVLFAVANYADEWGITYVGQERLAHDCKCRRATINDNLARLESCGLIARVKCRDAAGRKTSDHIVLAPLSDDRGPLHDAEKRAREKHPEDACALARQSTPSVHGPCTPHGDQSTRGVHEPLSEPATTTPNGVVSAASVRGKLVNRKPVTKGEAALAAAALVAFNERASTDYTLAGRALTCLVMRIREHPSLTAEDHGRIVDAAFSRPWWRDDTPTPSVIYGNRTLFERAAAQPGRRKGSGYQWDGDALEDRARRRIEGEL